VTMQSEAMRWGTSRLRGRAALVVRAGDDAERSDEVGAPPACGGERR
jgi:hypothetical protein